jgi:hypothetical protein
MTAKRSKRPVNGYHILYSGTYFAATAAQFPSGAMSASAHRPSSRITIFGLALIWTLAPVSPGAAHDSWINAAHIEIRPVSGVAAITTANRLTGLP